MIKIDKRTYSICIVSKSDKDNFHKHLDIDPDKSSINDIIDMLMNKKAISGQQRALEEAQRLANQTGKKVTVLTSAFNVYPSKE